MAEARRRGCLVLLLAATTACATEPSLQDGGRATPAELPDRANGRYAMIPANCGKVVTDDRLIVAPLRISFHESAGEIVQVEPAGPDRWSVTLAMMGEGRQWARHETLRLPPGGRTLSMGATLWHRCTL